jgi:hypothetical protein
MRGTLKESNVNLIEDIDRWRKGGSKACARLNYTGQIDCCTRKSLHKLTGCLNLESKGISIKPKLAF